MSPRARSSLVFSAIASLVCVGGPACQDESFFCSASTDCTKDGEAGTCEASGYCSFADPDCDSGRRYGSLAPEQLAGTCVSVDDTHGSSTSTGAPVGDDSSSGTSSVPATVGTGDGSTTSGDVSSSTTEDEGSSTSTGDSPEPLCCDASCSACEDRCVAEELDVSGDEDGEALAIVATQTHVYWTTGWQTDIRVVDLDSGVASRLADLPHTLTKITADEDFIYYLSHGEGFVGRVALDTGLADIVADVNAKTPGYEAGFGRLATDDAHVYFALEGPTGGPAGVFRTAKTPGGELAQVGDFPHPVAVVLDDAFVYVSDMESGLSRVPKDSLSEPQLLATVGGGPIVLRDDYVFVGAGPEMLRVSTDGGPATVVALADGWIEEMVADDVHLYATTVDGSVVRAALAGGEMATIASGGSPWGIATNCGHVFWCDNAALSIFGQPK
jgi:hypothetical protein